MRQGTVYAQNTLHAAAERLAPEVPFQIAIVELEDGSRLTVRIVGAKVVIGDRVVETPSPDGTPRFQTA